MLLITVSVCDLEVESKEMQINKGMHEYGSQFFKLNDKIDNDIILLFDSIGKIHRQDAQHQI